MSLEEKFPGLSRYVRRLPDGLDSHPACQSKGSLVLSALAGHDPAEIAQGLPEVLSELALDPPLAGTWASAVHTIALIHAIGDLYYPSEELLLKWGAQRTQSLGAHPLYRALLRVSSPKRFFSLTPRINRLLQRGTTFTNDELTNNRCVARLRYPESLHTRSSLLGTIATSRKVIELTGGVCTQARMTSYTGTEAIFLCEWE